MARRPSAATAPAPVAVTPRVPLQRDRVLRAAVDLADARGLGALTMRRLAEDLGVEAMTLYYHVANKDDLLAGMVDLVVAEMEVPAAEPDWRAGIRRAATSQHDVLVRHPWAAGQMLTGRVRDSRLRYMDALLGSLRAAGFSAEMTHHAYHALDSHVMGFTLWQVGIDRGLAQLPGTIDDFLAGLDRDALPSLAEHVEQHLRPEVDGVSEFDFGLDLLLDGLERLRLRDLERGSAG